MANLNHESLATLTVELQKDFKSKLGMAFIEHKVYGRGRIYDIRLSPNIPDLFLACLFGQQTRVFSFNAIRTSTGFKLAEATQSFCMEYLKRLKETIPQRAKVRVLKISKPNVIASDNTKKLSSEFIAWASGSLKTLTDEKITFTKNIPEEYSIFATTKRTITDLTIISKLKAYLKS
jgi:hypothetical protein